MASADVGYAPRGPRGLMERTEQLSSQASSLAAELGDLRHEAGRQALALQECMGALQANSEALLARLGAQQREDAGRAEALAHRQAALEREVRALERRAVEDRAWASAVCARREAIEARIALAEERQAAAARQVVEDAQECELRFSELREHRHELEAKAKATWKGRFNAMAMSQLRAADAVAEAHDDSDCAALSQSLAAAAAAVADAAAGPGRPTAPKGKSPPESLGNLLRCVQGLAEAERRRRGVLLASWSGDTGMVAPPMAANPRLGPHPAGDERLDLCGLGALGSMVSVPPCSASFAGGGVAGAQRGFSPPRALDWDPDARPRQHAVSGGFLDDARFP